MQGAAGGEHEPEIVIPAERVVPRKPVDEIERRLDHAREALRDLLQVAAQHAVRVDDALRRAGRAGREENLGNLIGLDGRVGARDIASGATRLEAIERGRPLPFEPAAGRDDLDVGSHGLRDGPLVRRPVGDEHEPRRQPPDDVREPPEVRRQERIGGGYRRERHPDVQGGEGEEPVFEAVLRKDGDRPLGTEPPIEQALRDPLDPGERLTVGQRAPAPAFVAAGEERAIRSHRGPVNQALRENARIRPEFEPGAEEHRAVGAGDLLDVHRPERRRAVGGPVHSSPTIAPTMALTPEATDKETAPSPRIVASFSETGSSGGSIVRSRYQVGCYKAS